LIEEINTDLGRKLCLQDIKNPHKITIVSRDSTRNVEIS